MVDGVVVKLEGIDELKKALADVSKKIRVKAVRSALRKAGAVIAKAARQSAPVLHVPTKKRHTGTVRKNIAVRNSKFARQAGDEGVFVGVRPLRGSRQKKLGKAGAANPNDPFYWRFLEFGTKKMARRAFLGPAVQQEGENAIKEFMNHVIPQIEKLDKKAGL